MKWWGWVGVGILGAALAFALWSAADVIGWATVLSSVGFMVLVLLGITLLTTAL